MTAIRFLSASLLRRLLVLAALYWLAACTTPPTRVDTAPDLDRRAVEQLLESGDFRGAADRLLARAAQADPTERDALRLAAAEALLRGGHWDAAEQILNSLAPSGPADYQARLAINHARLLIARRQPHDALRRLAAVEDPVPSTLQVDFHRTRAEAYTAAGNHLESARERVWLDGLLDAPAQAENHRAIWQALALLPDAVLRSMRTAPPPDVFSGWMELVETVHAQLATPAQWDIALGIWRERYPGHPAADSFVAELRQQALHPDRQDGVHAGRIAVLLPFSGALAEAGQAVRDGILAAYYRSAASDTELRFYDTGGASDEVAERIAELYQRAVAEGAQQIIGPLTKGSVAALAGLKALSVPVLALNTLGAAGPAPALLYQFGLTPEDEAVQVAQRAWHDGHRRALIMAPEGSWGDRLEQAFAEHWRSLGGTLLETQRFEEDQRGYSDRVRELLNIDASERRRQALTRLIGQQPEFEPRGRQDADLLFLVASATQARLLRPLLRFHRAGRLPVYTTSQIHDGLTNPSVDHDLDGVRFCDMPWMLQPSPDQSSLRSDVRRLWPEREGRYTRLYALGIDAFMFSSYLRGPGAGIFNRHSGVTGDLYLDQERRVHRELQWAVFRNGAVQALPPSIETTDIDISQPQELTDDAPDTEFAPDTGDPG